MQEADVVGRLGLGQFDAQFPGPKVFAVRQAMLALAFQVQEGFPFQGGLELRVGLVFHQAGTGWKQQADTGRMAGHVHHEVQLVLAGRMVAKGDHLTVEIQADVVTVVMAQ